MKRKEKLAKRAIRKHKKNIPWGMDFAKFLANPYASDEEEQADIDLMRVAWVQHYGELPEGFVAPLFEKQNEDEEQIKASEMLPWVATYKDLLLEKYRDKALVERIARFSLFTFSLGLGDATLPED